MLALTTVNKTTGLESTALNVSLEEVAKAGHMTMEEAALLVTFAQHSPSREQTMFLVNTGDYPITVHARD